MSSRPLLVGVTGGIGSGKSTVCKILEVLGHKVYYADDRAKWLMRHDEKLNDGIVALFGENAFVAGHLNRELIAASVFKDASLLKQLNALVHPAVGSDLAKWVAGNEQESILFDEAALMFEIGTYQNMDATILVTSPLELRIERILQRDSHRTEESVREIMDKQMPDADKIPLATYVIENDEKKSLIAQTLEVYDELINHRK